MSKTAYTETGGIALGQWKTKSYTGCTRWRNVMEKAPFLVLERSYEITIAWILERLRNLGLQTTITFDLQVARHAHSNCSCPHHGTEQCDCQMVVILVYGHGSKPVSLVVHSHEAITQISFVDTPQQPANIQLEKLLLQSLTSPVVSISPIDHSHVE